MNPLLDAQNGTLYNLDCTVFSPVRFFEKAPGKNIFIFSSDPSSALPKHLFLMPDGAEYDYSTFFFTFSPEVSIHREDGEVYYLITGTTNELTANRNELRVNISFDVSAMFDESSDEETVTVKNVSAGGFFFVSKNKHKLQSTIAFILSNSTPPVLVTAHIRSVRPTRIPGLYGYGCQFFGLNSKTEAAVRNFVFRAEVIQRKKETAAKYD